MTTVMTAQGNDDLKDNTSTTGNMPCAAITPQKRLLRDAGPADKQQFTAWRRGWSESALQYGVGLGAEARQPGSDGDLTENAASLRLRRMASCRWGKNWQLAPSVIAQHSEDRYRDGDRYDWATFNLRVSQGISAHFALLLRPRGGMDLNPNGRSYRYNDNVYPVSGGAR